MEAAGSAVAAGQVNRLHGVSDPPARRANECLEILDDGFTKASVLFMFKDLTSCFSLGRKEFLVGQPSKRTHHGTGFPWSLASKAPRGA